MSRNLKAPKQTDFKGPAKPQSGYMLFCDANRAATDAKLRAEKGDDYKVAMVLTELGAMWKNTSEADKAVFEEKSKAQKAKYDEEEKAWKLTEDYTLFKKASADIKKKNADKGAKLAAKNDANNPMPKRPNNAYLAFSSENSTAVNAELKAKGIDTAVKTGNVAKKIKEMWDALPDEEKNKREEKYKAASAKYKEDYAAWLETDAGKAFTAANEKAAEAKKGAIKRAREEAKDAKKEAKGSAPPMKKRKTAGGASSSGENKGTDEASPEESAEETPEEEESPAEEEVPVVA